MKRTISLIICFIIAFGSIAMGINSLTAGAYSSWHGVQCAGYSDWRLRSPSSGSNNNSYVGFDGQVVGGDSLSGCSTLGPNYGVLPALRLNDLNNITVSSRISAHNNPLIILIIIIAIVIVFVIFVSILRLLINNKNKQIVVNDLEQSPELNNELTTLQEIKTEMTQENKVNPTKKSNVEYSCKGMEYGGTCGLCKNEVETLYLVTVEKGGKEQKTTACHTCAEKIVSKIKTYTDK